MELTDQNIKIWSIYKHECIVPAKIEPGGVLAIHRQTVTSNDGETWEFYPAWVITHIPTGASVRAWIDTQKAAIEFLERILPLYDWKSFNFEPQSPQAKEVGKQLRYEYWKRYQEEWSEL